MEALSQAIPRLVALPGAAGASLTKRFKELLVMSVVKGVGDEGWSPGAEETVQETDRGNRLGGPHQLREQVCLS